MLFRVNNFNDILFFLKDTGKTIVIDSAQFRNMKNLSKLKGEVVVVRTCIDTCYNRCINRFDENFPNATELVSFSSTTGISGFGSSGAGASSKEYGNSKSQLVSMIACKAITKHILNNRFILVNY